MAQSAIMSFFFILPDLKACEIAKGIDAADVLSWKLTVLIVRHGKLCHRNK